MHLKATFFVLFVTLNLAGFAYATAQNNGNGKGKGGNGGDDPPSEALIPAYVHTLSGRNPSIFVANRDFSQSAHLTQMVDGRTRGIDHAPDEGRVLVEEFRALWETRYAADTDGNFVVTSRTLLFDGEASAATLRCIATGPSGAYAYSLTSAAGGELVIRTPGGQDRRLYNVGTLDSCDFNSDASQVVAIDNLPGAGGHELVSIDVATGGRTSLLFAPEDQYSLDTIMVAYDDQSYLLGWTDRRAGTYDRKLSEWWPGESLTSNPVIVTGTSDGSYACDHNGNGATDDGYVYKLDGTWFEVTATTATELISDRGNRGVYGLRPTC